MRQDEGTVGVVLRLSSWFLVRSKYSRMARTGIHEWSCFNDPPSLIVVHYAAVVHSTGDRVPLTLWIGESFSVNLSAYLVLNQSCYDVQSAEAISVVVQILGTNDCFMLQQLFSSLGQANSCLVGYPERGGGVRSV